MQIITYLIDLFLHLDKHLQVLLAQFGPWTYLLIFLVIFVETGVVIFPFLPGDSLLFAAGTLAALTKNVSLNVFVLYALLASAAVIGDNTNYWIGYNIGPRVFTEKVRFLKKEYLDRAHEFYVKHGAITIIIARFMPIIRTFSPFVAGVGRMPYARFVAYDILGGALWTGLFIFGGYFFGNLPFVRDHFSLVVIAIVLISVSPAVIGFIRSRFKPAVKQVA